MNRLAKDVYQWDIKSNKLSGKNSLGNISESQYPFGPE
jgi:hypothetical protein